MTPCNRRLLALALATALTTPALAQTTDPAPPATSDAPDADASEDVAAEDLASETTASAQAQDSDAPRPTLPPAGNTALPFTVSDIRVDGLQRISAGTVFTYLPVQRGEVLDAAGAAEAIRALYATGFFRDVSLTRQGSILVVDVEERPAINNITITGNQDIQTEDLMTGLEGLGLNEGGTFDRMALDRLTQELTRQYNNRGKYNVQITPTVSLLDRNRVDLTILINEGEAARIRHINLIGNETYPDEEILDRWESAESNWLSWYKRDDQYSREKLAGDIEKLNAWYLDRGYIDFSIDSTQVAISPDKSSMFITAGVTEGELYKVSDVEVTGETILPREQIERLVLVQPGQTFSRRLLEISSESITATLGNIGYAFAKVNPIPEIDREDNTVAIDMQVVPGPRVNVRRIVFKGNTSTADHVLRREMRQFEGAWYSQAAIDRSKIRLQRLGYFASVEVETPPVPGSQDQVDVVFTVEETTSGSFSLGLGFSQLSGVTTSAHLTQNNFLGSGNRISIQARRNDYLQRYDFSFVNPYFTDNGMSLGYNLWWREFDNADFNTAQYSSTSGAAQVVFGLPISETSTISALFGIDSNQIFTSLNTPKVITDYIKALDTRTFHAWRTELAWARDTRNDYFAPTRGSYHRISAEITLPGSTVEYYKINYEFTKYWPLSRALVLSTRAEIGYGDSYGDAVTRNICFTAPTIVDDDGDPATPPLVTPGPPPTDPCLPSSPDYTETLTADGLPFFENFYAGGVRSVRGFRDNTLGPQVTTGRFTRALGGALETVGSVELFFPQLLDTPAARVSAFLDFGNVYTDFDSFDADKLRASAGLALLWRAPVGPISISYAFPLRKEEGDEIERLQFTFGGRF